MSSVEEQKNQEEGKGFAGLSSMVSDIDATLASASKQAEKASSSVSSRKSAPPSRSAHQEQTRPTQQASKSTTEQSIGTLVGKGLLWTGGVFLVGIFVLAGVFGKPSPKAPDSSRITSVTPVNSNPVRPSPAAQPQAPSRPTENKPPVGRNNVLSTAQIRYCLAEKVRIDAAEGVINNYVLADVDRFNRYVDDYNNRCGAYQYRQGTLEIARREIEPYRSQLQAEGLSRFVSRNPSAATGTPDSSTAARIPPASTEVPKVVDLAPKATIQAIQRRLNELGYDAGSADGLFGKRTRAAIQAFQRDNGITVDGNASQTLLQKALAAEKRTPTNTSRLISGPERESLAAACSTDKYLNGEAAYQSCLNRKTAALIAGVPRPNLGALSRDESQSIEAVCSTDKYLSGPAAYNKCLTNQLASLAGQSGRPDLSKLSSSERQSIEAACSTDKYINGPAAYNLCRSRQLVKLGN